MSDRAAGLTLARKAWRKIVEPMNTEQVQDLLTSDEELSWVALPSLGISLSRRWTQERVFVSDLVHLAGEVRVAPGDSGPSPTSTAAERHCECDILFARTQGAGTH